MMERAYNLNVGNRLLTLGKVFNLSLCPRPRVGQLYRNFVSQLIHGEGAS